MIGALLIMVIVIGLATAWTVHWLSYPRKDRKVWQLLAVWCLVILFIVLYTRIAL